MKTNYPNWFEQYAENIFSRHLNEFKDRKVDFLQLGAYTGDATKWMFENVLTNSESTLVDVDTWEGSEEPIHNSFDWKNVEDFYDEKNSQWLGESRLFKKKMTTDEFFASNDKQFDFVYVDADHTAMSVLRDGINAYKSLKVNGVLAFDDYLWTLGNGDVMKDPKPAIDALLLFYQKRCSVIEVGTQVWLRKIS
jgi:hypothetical protein